MGQTYPGNNWLVFPNDDRPQRPVLLEHVVPAFEDASLARPSLDNRKDELLATLIQ
jgi:hypothetical protein